MKASISLISWGLDQLSGASRRLHHMSNKGAYLAPF